MRSDLHPADAAHAARLAHAGREYGVHYFSDVLLTISPPCEHGRPVAECLICIQLRHAEVSSVTIRAAHAFGDWPPAEADR